MKRHKLLLGWTVFLSALLHPAYTGAQSHLVDIISRAPFTSFTDYVEGLRGAGFASVGIQVDGKFSVETLTNGADTVLVKRLEHDKNVVFSVRSKANCEEIVRSVLPHRKQNYKYEDIRDRRIKWFKKNGWPRHSFVYLRTHEPCACRVYLLVPSWSAEAP